MSQSLYIRYRHTRTNVMMLLMLIVCTLVSGCLKAVRNDYLDIAQKQDIDSSDSPFSATHKLKRLAPFMRFADTLYIDIDSNGRNSPVVSREHALPMDKKLIQQNILFNEAEAQFNKDNFRQAKELYLQSLQIFSPTDSLYFESKFMVSESDIQLQQWSSAQSILEELLSQKSIHSDLRQRILLRHGQILCANNKHREAQKIFILLQKEYPESKYLAFADCK